MLTIDTIVKNNLEFLHMRTDFFVGKVTNMQSYDSSTDTNCNGFS